MSGAWTNVNTTSNTVEPIVSEQYNLSSSDFRWRDFYSKNITVSNTGVLTIEPGAGVNANGSVGANGTVLFSNGSSTYWGVVADGTVTNTGLVSNATGIHVLANNGITANITGVYVQANSGLVANTTGLFVLANNGIVSNTTGVFVLANNGIVSNTTGVFVLANSGIVSNSTGVFALSNNGLVTNATGTYVLANSGIVSNSNGVHILANTGVIANSFGLFVNAAAAIIANSGIVSNSTGVFVLANNGIVANSTGVFVLANSGIVSNTSGVFVLANSGIVVDGTGTYVNTAHIATLSANNATYLNTQPASYYTNATNLATGTVPTARLATGVASATTYLRGDQTWATITSSGGTVTSVTAGNGLAGGTITTSGTISVLGNTGISVAATGVSLATAGAGAATYSSGISSITVDAYGRVTSVSGSAGYVTSSGVTSLTAGNGLSGGTITSTGTVAVQPANGSILVSASGVAVNAAYIATLAANSATYLGAAGNAGDSLGIYTTGDIYLSTNDKKLRFKSTTGATNTLFTMQNDNNFVFYNTSSTGTARAIWANFGQSSSSQFRVVVGTEILSLGVGTPASGTTGEIRATDNITAYYSDVRLKTNIHPIQDALSKVKSISGVTYESNDVAAQYGYTNKASQVGVLAQEIEKVLPQAVKLAPFDTEYVDGVEQSKSGENYKTVQYEKIIPLLIEAIKELSAEIEELKRK